MVPDEGADQSKELKGRADDAFRAQDFQATDLTTKMGRKMKKGCIEPGLVLSCSVFLEFFLSGKVMFCDRRLFAVHCVNWS